MGPRAKELWCLFRKYDKHSFRYGGITARYRNWEGSGDLDFDCGGFTIRLRRRFRTILLIKDFKTAVYRRDYSDALDAFIAAFGEAVDRYETSERDRKDQERKLDAVF